MGSPTDSVSGMSSFAAPAEGSPSSTSTPVEAAASAAAGRAISPSHTTGTPPLRLTTARPIALSTGSSDDSSISGPTRDAAYYTALLRHAISTFKTSHTTNLQTELAKLPQSERCIVMEGITTLSSSEDSDEVKCIKLCNASAILLSKFPIPEETTGPGRIATGALNTFANMGSRISSSQLAEAISGPIPGMRSPSVNFSSINPSEELKQVSTVLVSLLTRSTATTETIQTTYEDTTNQWKRVIAALPKKGDTTTSYFEFKKARMKFIKTMQSSNPNTSILSEKINQISIPQGKAGYNSSLFEACEEITTLIQKQKDLKLETQQKQHDMLLALSGELALAQEAANRNPIAPTKPGESSALSYKDAKKNLDAGNKIVRRIQEYLTTCTDDEDSDTEVLAVDEARDVAAFINNQYSLIDHKPQAIKSLQSILQTSKDLEGIKTAANTFISTFQNWQSIANDYRILEAEASRAQAAADRLTIAKEPPISQSTAAAAPAAAPGLKPQSAEPAAAAPTTPAAAPAPALSTSNRASSFASFSDSNNLTTKASTLITQLRVPPKGQWSKTQLITWDSSVISSDLRNQTYGKFYELATAESSPIKKGFQTYCRGLTPAQQGQAGEIAFRDIESLQTTQAWNEVRAQAIQAVFFPSQTDKK